jgi:methylglutaconyl-CoA hydratase
MPLVQTDTSGPIARITLNDPQRRNALGHEMFDAFEAALRDVEGRDAVPVLLLHGHGPAFCAGFDLAAAVDEPSLLREYILRLSGLTRGLRRLPQVVVCAAHGAAIAGGCALISACDFVVADAGAKIGYPVHRLGISPAVSMPTLRTAIGFGPARSMLMSDRLIDGVEAQSIGLVSEVVDTADGVLPAAEALCERLAGHGLGALRATKGWLNELDGSLDDRAFDAAAEGTTANVTSPETLRLLQEFWSKRSAPGS